MTEEILNNAREEIKKKWPESADAVIEACDKAEKFNGSSYQFFEHCFCCGGNWVGMILSGIEKLWPEVYELLPDTLGKDGNWAFINLCYVLQLCGVDTSK